jgi:hypothetical protein
MAGTALACDPPPPGLRLLTCPGIRQLPGDRLRLVAPVIPVFPNIAQLRAQQFRSLTQRSYLGLEDRCNSHWVQLRCTGRLNLNGG